MVSRKPKKLKLVKTKPLTNEQAKVLAYIRLQERIHNIKGVEYCFAN